MEKTTFIFVPVLPAAVLTLLICHYRTAHKKQVSWGTVVLSSALATVITILALAFIKSDAIIFTSRYWFSYRRNVLGDLFDLLVIPMAMAAFPSWVIVFYCQWRKNASLPTSSPDRKLYRWEDFIHFALVLVVVFALAFFSYLRRTRSGGNYNFRPRVEADLAVLEQRIEAFRQIHGRLPSNQEGLSVLPELPPNATTSQRQVKGKIPRDLWGSEYQYVYPGTHNPHGYDLYSFGPDGRLGGDDDFGNWGFSEMAPPTP